MVSTPSLADKLYVFLLEAIEAAAPDEDDLPTHINLQIQLKIDGEFCELKSGEKSLKFGENEEIAYLTQFAGE